MKRLQSLFMMVAMVAALSLSTSGCAATRDWWASFKADPVAGVSDVTSYIRTALGLARTGFEIYAAAAGPSSAEARTRFETIAGTVERGVLVAQDGLRLAANLRQAEPNVDTLTSDARSAMLNLHAFLQGLPGVSTGQASNPTLREAIAATQAAARPRVPSSGN